MGKLGDIARGASLLDITITVNGEKVRFNLYKELRIQSNDLNSDILAQPRLYSFLSMVYSECKLKEEEAEAAAKRIYAELYVKFKKLKGESGRPNSDDMSKALAEKSTKYQVALRKVMFAKQKSRTIYTCLEGFRQRKDLIQTLSSNIRNNS